VDAIPTLLRRRKRRTFERQKTGSRLTRGVIGVGLALATVVGGLIIGGAFAYAALTANLPSLNLLPSLLNPQNGSLLQPTRIYDRTGEHLIMVLAPQDAPRIYAGLHSSSPTQLPETLTRATIALVDPGFWNHPGYLLDGLDDPDRHPTLAQKLVSDLLLWDEPPSLGRAIRERMLAAQLTARYGREQILEWYLNSANFGHYAYGANAAASLYLGKDLSQLNLAEAVLLVSVSESPAINPFDARQAALQRQQEALNLLQVRGGAANSEIELARKTSINFKEAIEAPAFGPAFVALALSQLGNRFDSDRVERGGMQLLTTLDYDLQLRMECALQSQFGINTPGNCSGTAGLPPLPPGQALPEATSAAVLDPRSGQVLALVGDAKPGSSPVYVAPHRPGTLLTPFVYLAGFTRGLSPASLVWDLPSQDSSNPDAQSYLGPLRLRNALTSDRISTASQVFDQMGAGLVQQTMTPFGLDITAGNLQDLMESGERFSVIQMARAYGIFANQGILSGLAPGAVLEVRDLAGKTLADWRRIDSAQVVSAQLAYLVTDMLGANLAELGRPATLKTGVTPDGLDTWAAGYTPNRVVVVWMGGQKLSTRPAMGLWSAIMQAASQAVPPDDWPMPAGMLRLRVCDPSGMLPTAACPNVVDEIFIEGFQPVQADTLYRSFAVNRETGLLATVFTPERLVEKRIYMQVPPAGQAWAKTAGLPVPPTQYDNIMPPAPNPEANITSPDMLSQLQGKLAIAGTAAGADFSYYRLQYGQGLYPETWIQIGADINSPVENGRLAEWDTSGLRGLYSLQLLVVRVDHSLQTATIQVTLTNP
jgi:membrane carboxypeptidase/penicillin-binding protein